MGGTAVPTGSGLLSVFVPPLSGGDMEAAVSPGTMCPAHGSGDGKTAKVTANIGLENPAMKEMLEGQAFYAALAPVAVQHSYHQHDGYNSNSSCQEAEDVCGTYYFHDETQQEGRKHADWDCTDKPRYGWGCCIRLHALLLRSRVPALDGCHWCL